MVFKGAGFDPDGRQVPFNSDDNHHKLDGFKLNSIALVANLTSQYDLDKLTNFLEIAKFTLDNENEKKIAKI